MKPERPKTEIGDRPRFPEADCAKRDDVAGNRGLSPISGDDVPSPCVSICEMSPDTGLCRGCFRTLDEIAAWSVLDAATRRAIVDALPARRARPLR